MGVIINTLEGDVFRYGVQLQFPATNNEAEYEAIVTGLRVEKALGTKNLFLQSDSKLVIRQRKGEYEAKEDKMQKYLRLTNHQTQKFDQVDFTQVPRNQNLEADEVARQASSGEGTMLPDLKMEVQKHPNIEEFHTLAIQYQNSWTTPILSFLRDGRLLADIDEAKKVRK